MVLAIAAVIPLRRLAMVGFLIAACGVLVLTPTSSLAQEQPTARLTGPAGPTSGFGSSIAVSKDGNTVAIGGDTDNEGRGAVWVFTRSGSSWVQQGPKLTPDGPSGVAYFGSQVAISASGNAVLVGDRQPGPLAAWVFTLRNGVWRQQGPPLAPRAPRGDSPRGESEAVALSAHGTTAIISGDIENVVFTWTYVRSGRGWKLRGHALRWPASAAALSGNGSTLLLGEGGEKGIAQVFVRSGSRWKRAGRALPGSGVEGFASSVALSADGHIAMVGGRGYARLYRRSRAGWVEVARLLSPHAEADVEFGATVALSSDGKTALVGASPAYDAPSGVQGAEYIFTRTAGNHWVLGAKLPTLSGPVALSGVGSTIVAAPPNETGTATHVFVRSGARWRQEAPILAPTGLIGTDSGSFGGSFALSADAGTALVAEGNSAWVFARSGQNWIRQTQLQLPAGIKGEGVLVALSADGNTAVLAGPSAPGAAPGAVAAAWVFSRTGTTWSTNGTPLLATDSQAPPPGSRGQDESFASSVAVSADGETVLVGAPQDAKDTGAVFVFARSGAGWTEQGPKLTASNPSTEERFGRSVALSAGGETALVGAPGNSEGPTNGNPGAGAAYVFTRSGAGWAQSAKLTDGEKHPYSTSASIFLGTAVALSANGDTALLGAHNQALLFTKTASGWSQAATPFTPYAGERNSNGAPNAFGDVLALSDEGNTALIGGLAEDDCGKYMYDSCSSTATVWAFSRSGETWVRQPDPLVRALPFGSPLALSANGEIALIGGVTPGPLPGGAVFVSQLTPPPQSGFIVETTTHLYHGEIEQQLWSATPGRFSATARVTTPLPRSRPRSLPIYGTATATAKGPESVSLTIKSTAVIRKYLKEHKRLTLIVTIQEQPEAPMPVTTQTLTLKVEFTKPPPPEY
jgi:hypothetical protein